MITNEALPAWGYVFAFMCCSQITEIWSSHNIDHVVCVNICVKSLDHLKQCLQIAPS